MKHRLLIGLADPSNRMIGQIGSSLGTLPLWLFHSKGNFRWSKSIKAFHVYQIQYKSLKKELHKCHTKTHEPLNVPPLFTREVEFSSYIHSSMCATSECCYRKIYTNSCHVVQTPSKRLQTIWETEPSSVRPSDPFPKEPSIVASARRNRVSTPLSYA